MPVNPLLAQGAGTPENIPPNFHQPIDLATLDVPQHQEYDFGKIRVAQVQQDESGNKILPYHRQDEFSNMHMPQHQFRDFSDVPMPDLQQRELDNVSALDSQAMLHHSQPHSDGIDVLAGPATPPQRRQQYHVDIANESGFLS
jgi:hypothetical protein